MSFGEYIDLDNFLGDWDKMHKAMSVLYRPTKTRTGALYSIKNYEGDIYHESMKQMPLDAVFHSIVFFYTLGIELSKTMMNYLDKDQTQALTQYLTSQPNGDGITQFTDLLKETLQDMKISLN